MKSASSSSVRSQPEGTRKTPLAKMRATPTASRVSNSRGRLVEGADATEKEANFSCVTLNEKAVYDLKMNFNIAVRNREIRKAIEAGEKILLCEPDNKLVKDHLPLLRDMIALLSSSDDSNEESSSSDEDFGDSTRVPQDVTNFAMSENARDTTTAGSTSPQTTNSGDVPTAMSVAETDSSGFTRVD